MRRYIRALWHLIHRRAFYKANLALTKVTFPFDGSSVTLEGERALELATDIFMDNAYGDLEVKGKTVIDLGANIGDTPIYFARRGAKEIVSMECDPSNFELLRKNMERNGTQPLSSHILGYAGGKTDTKTNTFSLDDILNMGNPPYAVKSDMEGAEYDTFLNASDKTLRRIDEIIMEYHGCSIPLTERLEKAGFKTTTRYEKCHIHAVKK